MVDSGSPSGPGERPFLEDGACGPQDGAGGARNGVCGARDGEGSARDGAGGARNGASGARDDGLRQRSWRAAPRAALLLLALPLLAAQAATAAQEAPRTGTGALLHERCQLYFEFLGRTGAGREDTFRQDPFGMGYCAGLVRGVVIAAQSFMPDRVCMPPGATVAQVVRRIVLYLDQHPQERGELDVELVLRALEDRYRCP